jgi:hypothetical protein
MTVPEITNGPKGRRVVLAHDMQFSAIVSLLHSLMVGGMEFAFYDPKYPSPSDPGAYFSYSPMNGMWRMTLGNHGWSGGIYEIDAPVVANQLWALYSTGLLSALELAGVHFFSHYQPESRSENEAMNMKLRGLHPATS